MMAQSSLDNFKFQDNSIRNRLKSLKKSGSYVRIAYISSHGAKKLFFAGFIERISMKRVEIDNACTVRYIPIQNIQEMEVLQ
ncbi:MAG: hypothetical protein ACYDAP_03590 [Thermoplasmataceae archaeon]